MHLLRFVSASLITLVLAVLGAILVTPTSEMVTGYRGSGVGPGVLPAACLIGTLVLAAWIFVSELRLFLRSRGTVDDPAGIQERFGMPLAAFLRQSITVIALLCIYVALWLTVSFVPATLFFTVGMAFTVTPKHERTARRLATTAMIMAAASFTIWGVFVHLLGVSLR